MEAKDFNFSIGHLGIWHQNEEEDKKVVDLLVFLFGFDVVDAPPFGWNIDENRIEIINGPGKGTKGHFSVLCDDIVNAKKHLEEKGVVFNEETMTYNKEGVLWKVFARDEISGFAWHLALRGHANNGY